MNVIHFPRLKTRRRKNPQWLLDLARHIGHLRGRFMEYHRLRRTGLHRRACFWCAWNLK
ncbi:hypothetical protein GALL_71690 [mine drainage metagenome]|uniref:Uncharacterized protein n=1 Tax=mine drainage metagenome TaxID=410659 RepID=A0A1J5TG52_9ZZZZ